MSVLFWRGVRRREELAKNGATCPGKQALAQKDVLWIQEPAQESGTQLSNSDREGKYEKSWLGEERWQESFLYTS